MSITDGVGEGIRSVEVTVRRIGQRAIAIVGYGSAGSLCEGVDAKRVGVNVGVIRERVHDDGFVFVDGGGIIVSDGIVVDRRDRDVDIGSTGAALPVTDRVGEGVTAVEVGVGCVGQCAIAIVGDGSAGSLGEGVHADRVAIDVAVIREYVDDDRFVFVDGG